MLKVKGDDHGGPQSDLDARQVGYASQPSLRRDSATPIIPPHPSRRATPRPESDWVSALAKLVFVDATLPGTTCSPQHVPAFLHSCIHINSRLSRWRRFPAPVARRRRLLSAGAAGEQVRLACLAHSLSLASSEAAAPPTPRILMSLRRIASGRIGSASAQWQRRASSLRRMSSSVLPAPVKVRPEIAHAAYCATWGKIVRSPRQRSAADIGLVNGTGARWHLLHGSTPACVDTGTSPRPEIASIADERAVPLGHGGYGTPIAANRLRDGRCKTEHRRPSLMRSTSAAARTISSGFDSRHRPPTCQHAALGGDRSAARLTKQSGIQTR